MRVMALTHQYHPGQRARGIWLVRNSIMAAIYRGITSSPSISQQRIKQQRLINA